MCWVSYKPWQQEVATRDIECFKICNLIDNKIYSLYQKFEYQLNTVYKAKLSFKKQIVVKTGKVISYEIIEGIHSYSTKCRLKQVLVSATEGCKELRFLKIIKDEPLLHCMYLGLHHYEDEVPLDCICLDSHPNAVLVKCIIPEGSIYFINEDEEIVSNQIILTKIAEL